MSVHAPSGLAVAAVIGTRPEAIKLFPVMREMMARGIRGLLISTGQQRDLSSSILQDLEMDVHLDLDLMEHDQSPQTLTSRILDRLPSVFREFQITDILVQGDTTTAFAGAYAGYLSRLRVGHIEAGLRTGDIYNPFPEEGNRKLIGQIANLHFAPTALAAGHLLSEGISGESIHVVGNTSIDTLSYFMNQKCLALADRFSAPYLLVTLHRRESLDGALSEIMDAIEKFISEFPDAYVKWPVHPNPRVYNLAHERFEGNRRVELMSPQGYLAFIRLLAGARLILTDSGGVQEEAPSLGKVVLVARDDTERPEGISGGSNVLVGRSSGPVTRFLRECWVKSDADATVRTGSPFGDGNASRRIVSVLCNEPYDPFAS